MYSEDDLLPVSALQHLAFCQRQWALIHLEQQWAENLLTAEGRVMHERVHAEESETRIGVRMVRGLRIRSLRLGLVGVADVVEFTRTDGDALTTPETPGTRLSGVSGRWRPKPVEYKRGRPKPDRSDEVQLCAQALCLEEMLSILVPSGAIFYGKPRRRKDVEIDNALRQETEALSARLHELHRGSTTPTAVYGKKCRNCSLLDLCQPKATGSRTAAGKYIEASLRDIKTSDSETGPAE